MLENVKIVAIILAGGNGKRLGNLCPKQFMDVKGISIIQRTINAFEGQVDGVLVVCRDEWRSHVAPCPTAKAGATGFDSLRSGVAALSMLPDDTLVMIHDAVRPLVSAEVIRANLDVARRCGNAIAAVEVYETLLFTPQPDGVVQSMTRREGMYRAQTPQTFTLGTLRAMISEADRQGISDVQSACVLAQQLGYELHLSPGDFRNFKITTPSDLQLYEALIP